MTDAPPRSLLARKRAERDEKVQDLAVYLLVPSWGKDLVLKIGLLEREQIDAFQQAKRSTGGDANFLAQAVRAIYMHDPDKTQPGPRMPKNDQFKEVHDQYVMLVDENDLAITLDERFVEALGLEPEIYDTPQKVVTFIFANNTFAQGAFTVRVVRWMENTDVSVSESLLGELLAQGTQS